MLTDIAAEVDIASHADRCVRRVSESNASWSFLQASKVNGGGGGVA